ncbi:metal ABC transporter substrate-binding protein [Veillonella rodentium]|uniref:Probable zinc transport system zinc-binding lipoprotein AdcA n=1 Tax=Veillonella rodentium TaxID=248315 RepID=A0A239YF41_9FIRM|nr:metal ABC transporter substrate-binding protein [Veillonella rodentium]SNV57013.1 Probable zinc transport system zinc-binding lipoprotein AdcA precursor [Veillonella rodentium]
MVRKLVLLVIGILMTAVFAGCGNDAPKEQANKKVQVVTSFNAMAEFAKAIGGDKVEVSTIIPDGTEPHDFELKPENMKQLSSAQLFVYNGLGMEPWDEQAIAAAKNDKLVSVKASDGVETIKNTDPEEIKEHGAEDPHAWLSLKNAKIEVKNIKDALVKADPANKDYYEKNYTDYVAKLDAMIKKYEDQFAKAPHKNFVTGHAAFAYLCRDFGLEQNSVEDVFAEGEPNAAQLAKLIEYCKDNHITTIFAEEMASPDVSKTLAQEVGAKVETIYTIESNEDNKSYLDRMDENLTKIVASLQ